MSIGLRITPYKPQKFVLVHSTDRRGKEIMLLWGNPTAEWHKDIVDEILNAGFEIEVIGGGRVIVLPDIKTVYMWDKSTRYGGVPFETICAAIEESLPGYAVRFEEPPY